MTLLYHPKTLKLLRDYKVSNDEIPGDELLVAILDSRESLANREEMFGIFCRYKPSDLSKDSRLGEIYRIISERMIWKYYSFDEESMPHRSKDALEISQNLNPNKSNEDGVWILERRSLDRFDTEFKALIFEQRRDLIESKYKSYIKKKDESTKGSPSRLTAKKRENVYNSLRSLTTFNFTKIEEKRKAVIEMGMRFRPIAYDSKTKVFMRGDERFRRYFTIRKDKDIEFPKKITYIKLHDKIKPPFYGFPKGKCSTRISTNKIDLVSDYEYDSDVEWIDDEEGECIDSTDDEEETNEEGMDNDDWIEAENEDEEERRGCRVPTLEFPSCEFIKYKTFDDSWLNIPLVKRSVFPEDHLQTLREGLGESRSPEAFARMFGEKFHIKPSVVLKKIKEITLGLENPQR